MAKQPPNSRAQLYLKAFLALVLSILAFITFYMALTITFGSIEFIPTPNEGLAGDTGYRVISALGFMVLGFFSLLLCVVLATLAYSLFRKSLNKSN